VDQIHFDFLQLVVLVEKHQWMLAIVELILLKIDIAQ